MTVHYLNFDPGNPPGLDAQLRNVGGDGEHGDDFARLEIQLRLKRLVASIAVQRSLGSEHDHIWPFVEQAVQAMSEHLQSSALLHDLGGDLVDILLAANAGMARMRRDKGEQPVGYGIYCRGPGEALTLLLRNGEDFAPILLFEDGAGWKTA